MEDFINPAKEVDSDKYWTRPNDQRQWLHKGEISLLKNRMYSQLFDTQITDENKLNSASAWVCNELCNKSLDFVHSDGYSHGKRYIT